MGFSYKTLALISYPKSRKETEHEIQKTQLRTHRPAPSLLRSASTLRPRRIDIKHPTHEYAPKDPRPALQDETIETVDSNVSVLSVVVNKIVKAKIADILGLKLDDEVSSPKPFKSPQVKTETLQQH